MKQTKILCDNCSEDLTQLLPTDGIRYRLLLQCEEIPVATDCYGNKCEPAPSPQKRPVDLKEDRHFCNRDCLSEWLI